MCKTTKAPSRELAAADGKRTTWIDWDSPFLARNQWLDPTRIFSFLVIAIMCLRYLHGVHWNVSLLVCGFFMNPFVVTFFSLAVGTAYFGLRRSNDKQSQLRAPMPVYDRWAAEWYWWNAWLFHMVMDGASGSFRLVPVVVQQYDVLDLRFPTHHVVPWIIGVIELFLMAPLCLMTLYAILKKNDDLRFPLELITSTLQFMGMIAFVAAELYEGQVNVPALDPVGRHGLKLNFYHFTYYWFGFWFCNLIWGVIPVVRILRAFRECRRGLLLLNSKAD